MILKQSTVNMSKCTAYICVHIFSTVMTYNACCWLYPHGIWKKILVHDADIQTGNAGKLFFCLVNCLCVGCIYCMYLKTIENIIRIHIIYNKYIYIYILSYMHLSMYIANRYSVHSKCACVCVCDASFQHFTVPAGEYGILDLLCAKKLSCLMGHQGLALWITLGFQQHQLMKTTPNMACQVRVSRVSRATFMFMIYVVAWPYACRCVVSWFGLVFLWMWLSSIGDICWDYFREDGAQLESHAPQVS